MRLLVVLVLSALLAPLAAGSMAKVPAPPVEDAVVRAGPAPCGTAAQGRSRDGQLLLDELPAGMGAFALVRTGRSIWVTSFAGRDVRLYRTG